MTTRGALAYAHSRIRAAKSHLLTRAGAMPLFAAIDASSVQRAVAALDLEQPVARMVRVYAAAIRGYGAPLLRAMFALHEIENVKLLWRATAKRRDAETLWIDFGPLATVSYVEASTPRELAERLGKTPYASIAATVARAHGDDLAAAELAFDRWATQRLRDEARKLPRREAIARKLAESIARERDAEIVRRGAQWYGLASVQGRAEDVVALRRERLRLCRRAFVGSPFLLAPAVAVVILAEEEVRAVRALVEREGDETLDAPLHRALAGSQIGG